MKHKGKQTSGLCLPVKARVRKCVRQQNCFCLFMLLKRNLTHHFHLSFVLLRTSKLRQHKATGSLQVKKKKSCYYFCGYYCNCSGLRRKWSHTTAVMGNSSACSHPFPPALHAGQSCDHTLQCLRPEPDWSCTTTRLLHLQAVCLIICHNFFFYPPYQILLYRPLGYQCFYSMDNQIPNPFNALAYSCVYVVW